MRTIAESNSQPLNFTKEASTALQKQDPLSTKHLIPLRMDQPSRLPQPLFRMRKPSITTANTISRVHSSNTSVSNTRTHQSSNSSN